MKQREKNFDINDWGGYAKCYDSLNALRPYQNLQRRVADEILKTKVNIILDVACGTGNLTQILLKKNAQIEISAVDFSQEMLSRAQKKCPDMRVNFLHGDLNQTLPFKDDAFDCIASINTLYAVKSPGDVLREFARVLKRGGKLILVTPKNGSENGLILKEHCKSSKLDEYWLNAHSSPEREWRLIQEAIKDGQMAQKMLAVAKWNREINTDTSFHFFEIHELRELVEQSGFSIVKSETIYAKQAIIVCAYLKGETA